ncbi:MAG: GspE/PulE family protein [Dehalococcoidia bacterium]
MADIDRDQQQISDLPSPDSQVPVDDSDRNSALEPVLSAELSDSRSASVESALDSSANGTAHNPGGNGTGSSPDLLPPGSDEVEGTVERSYEGTVKLSVLAHDIHRMLRFVDEMDQTPEFRLLGMTGSGTDRIGMEVWLGLRRELPMETFLQEVEGVAKVSQERASGKSGQESSLIVELQKKSKRKSTESTWSASFSLPEMLTESGLLTSEQILAAQRDAATEKLPLWQVLMRQGAVLPLQLAALNTLNLGLPMADLRSQNIDPQAISLLPEELARRYTVLPLEKQGDQLTVAMPDPTDLRLIQDLTTRTGSNIAPIIATPRDILEHIDISYRLIQNTVAIDEPEAILPEGGQRLTPRLLRNSPPVQIIDLLLRQALQDRASDIHIEATEDRLRIRFRIDSILQDVMDLPLDMHPILISRLKIMAGMNIAERRRAQDGQFTVDVRDRRIDVRVAVSNTVQGEMTVLRLLDKKFTLIGLDQLGMSQQNLAEYRKLLRLPYGMIIVCGPTGAGKSTTLYASVLQINRLEQNVISLEDPVEYHIANTNQMQVHNEAGVTFASQLRSILRLDPDVILVGEIRDQETAIIATQAALTGHLVLTSLHANDSVSALLRFRDLGVPPYLIASSVAGIVAQRMVRVVCDNCKASVPRPLEEQEAYLQEMGEHLERFSYGQGCNMCAGTGYRERTGVFETLVMTDEIRQLLLEDVPRNQLWDHALKEGMVPLRKDGMQKVEGGITTPYEVLRVLFSLE